jgi:uncharacterized repeat protein (TIGR02543 family)
MKIIPGSRRNHYARQASIFLIAVAMIAGMVGCAPARYNLTISSTEGGEVTSPGEGTFTYDEGKVVSLAAEAEEGYTFVNWTGDVETIADVNNVTTTITMLDHYSITANFTQSQFKTYSKYGFSFEYPTTFSDVIEMGMLEGEANDISGMVQVWVENEEVELFQVGWMTILPDEIESGPGGLEGNLKDDLEGGFAILESSEEIVSVEKGELVEATKAGHLIFYQYYTATSTEGDKMYGVASCFYCDESQKLFSLMTMNNTISAEEDGLADFHNYLDSFVCH